MQARQAADTTVLRKRLQNFRARKTKFQKLRRAVGAEGTNVVLRAGGTAALTYCECNAGVSTSMLYTQRSSVAAASSVGAPGDLDLTLALVDGSMRGHAGPAFAAHEGPITKWAEAVWCHWLPLGALRSMCTSALQRLAVARCPWAVLHGLGLGFVASAQRLGWTVDSATSLTSDTGAQLDLVRDPPAMITSVVRESVWRWRWRRLEAKHPHLVQGAGGHGPFLQPIFKLLKPRDLGEWGPQQRGALRSAFLNRQWPQARLKQAGKVDSPNCRLCVALGYCSDSDSSPELTGHMLHRVLLCRPLDEYRKTHAPAWIIGLAASYRSNGYLLPQSLFDLLTRALMRSPAPLVDAVDQLESFEWIMQPLEGVVDKCTVYVDGSRLYAEHGLYGMCVRRGWAFCLMNSRDEIIASARGRPPAWCDGIYGAELWALLQGSRNSGPFDALRMDCLAVQLGTQKGTQWAGSPSRKLGRAWGQLAALLEGDEQRAVWMPAHYSQAQVGQKRLSNGDLLSTADLVGNDCVDALAKQVAQIQRPPTQQMKAVRGAGVRLTEAAMWLGRCTALANHFPNPAWTPGMDGKLRYLRDSQGSRALTRKSGPPKGCPTSAAATALPVTRLGDLSECSRWAALRDRVRSKAADGPRGS